ncbi:MAG TPA: hypothetical protein VG650_15530 [Mycobacteriales bacterium]|nr:hypothetical protein [Mycobacteriales bacterium]
MLACILLSLFAFTASFVTSPAAGLARPQTKSVALANIHHATAKLHDPRRNVSPSPDYLANCAVNGSNSKSCVKQALQAINNARAAEGVRPMILPADYTSLSMAQQTFIVTDLERVDRGLRPFKGLTAKLNANAHHAAVVRADPTLVNAVMALLGVREYGSIWAGDFGPLASDYDWMYNDGYSANGSVNLDCQTRSAKGCWGHRHVILGAYSGLPTLVAGAGTAKPAGSSIAQIFVGSVKSSFQFVYTWRQALDAGASGHKILA